ncbi:MAG: hypothetical protein OBKJMPBA_00009 [Methanophagales virus PBV304]|uniref:Uncharacterized protein n=1 Tax=Methanophagales virus PBV304 TaxID=3071309 RepID=A0AA46TEC0_9VIRU|nr:MAG: hypothetical protein QIT47_gp09 [Methanophagales virus PBV304]UYL65041.1 MAG: hypothetical protein OBKJMPBA_00009 [Methanophagales virus PBV304]
MRVGDIITKIVEIATTPIKTIADAIDDFAKDFAQTLKEGVLMIIKHFESEFKPDIERIIPKELMEHDYFKNWKDYIEETAGQKPIALASILTYLGTTVGGVAIGLGLGGFGRSIQNFFNTQLTPTPLNPAECAYYMRRKPENAERIKEMLLAQGYATDLHYYLLEMYKPKLTIGEIINAYLRGLISENDFNLMLKEHGLADRDIDVLKGLMWSYPSPTDFIRFAVREVFTKDKETQEALSAEFPDDIVEYAEKAGMRKEVLEWYWKAHWDLPSPTQVYEMLHRLNPDVLKVRGSAYKDLGLDISKLETTIDTVKQFLKQADYDLRWRDRLVAISYSPLTRVDLRRIYELGLISDEELLARLMELGYTKKDAELMVEFYKTFKQEEAKTFAKTEIKYLLYYGIIGDAEAKVMLERLGYSEEDAKTLIELWKVKLAEKDMRETQQFVRDAYALGEITRTDAERMLKEAGLSDEVIAVVLDKEDKRRLSSQKLPSASTIVKWLKLGIITKDVAYRLLKRINVAEDVIDYYIKEAEVEAS